MDALLHDIRQACRGLWHNKHLTIVAVLTLALGVGANAAMFDLVDRLLFRVPSAIASPERLVTVRNTRNYIQYLDLTSQVNSLELAAYTRSGLSLGLGAQAIALRAECVTHTYFSVLGVKPLLGRTFTEAEDLEGGQALVILGHGLWKREFGEDAAILGKTLAIAGRAYTIIGVAPPGFRGVEIEVVDAWILLTVSPEACSYSGRNLLSSSGGWLDVIGRIRDGFTLEGAEAESSSLVHSGISATRDEPARQLEPIYASTTRLLSRENRVAVFLAGGALVVLLIASSNVAGLLSIRALERRREIAVRLQLGATRRRLLAQLLAENAVLAVLCLLVAVVVSVWISAVLRQFFSSSLVGEWMDGRVIAVMAAFAMSAGLLSGIGPALQVSGASAGEILRSGGLMRRERSWLRNALLIAQIGLALVLVVAAGLFVRSVANVSRDPGYDIDRVVVATIDLQRAGFTHDEDIRTTFEALAERVRGLSEVEFASLSFGPILGSGVSNRAVPIRTVAKSGRIVVPIFNAVSEDYFATLGTRILRGRSFGVADGPGRPAVILSEGLAKELWPGGDAIGQCTIVGKVACAEVVGVTESRRHGSITRTIHEFFVPLRQATLYGSAVVPRTLLVRPRVKTRDALAPIAAAVRGASARLPFASVQPLSDLVDVQTRSWRLGATMFGLFGGLALSLAAVGLYGVLAFAVRQRAREIATRVALGALPGDIVHLVFRHGLFLVAIGWLLGNTVALAVTRLIRRLLFDVTPTDGLTFCVASLIVAALALAGCTIPAVRAARIDPAVALRQE